MLVDVICVTPAIWENCRSSGCATVEAMVSGLAPGNDADTLMVGKSTLGSGATGKRGKATMPVSATAIIKSEVATGRRMKGAEMFMARSSRPPALQARWRQPWSRVASDIGRSPRRARRA